MGWNVPNSAEWYDEVSDVEAIIRSAADYVQVSRDLRPRILDMARVTNGERRVRRSIRQVGLVAALLMWCLTTSIDKLDGANNLRELTWSAVGLYPASNNRVSAAADDPAWVLVDAYTELRGKQAEVLRLRF